MLARWQRTIVDEAGNIRPGATLTVRREADGAPLAALFSDRDGAVPISNPFDADALTAFAAFHAEGGPLRIDVVDGAFTQTLRYIAVGTAAESDATAFVPVAALDNLVSFDDVATEDDLGIVELSSTAEVRAAGASDDTVIRSRMLRDAAALVTLTDAATVALNWTAGINFTLTLTTDRVLGNPSNGIPGTTRTVFVISDGGPDELTFGNQYGGESPTLDDITTTKGYLLSIYCRTATQFLVTAINGSPA